MSSFRHRSFLVVAVFDVLSSTLFLDVAVFAVSVYPSSMSCHVSAPFPSLGSLRLSSHPPMDVVLIYTNRFFFVAVLLDEEWVGKGGRLQIFLELSLLPSRFREPAAMAQWLFVAQGERRTPLPQLRYLWERGFLGVVLRPVAICWAAVNAAFAAAILASAAKTRVTR